MKYQIPQDKLKKIVFKFLDNLPKLQGIKFHKVNPGFYEFHKWTQDDEEFFDIDPPFRYYTEKYPLKNFANFPLLVISNDIHKEISDTFGKEKKFIEYVVEWFKEKYELPVKEYE